MAGETATALRVFSILVGNAVAEERFSDAGYLHHLLATQCLDTADNSTNKYYYCYVVQSRALLR